MAVPQPPNPAPGTFPYWDWQWRCRDDAGTIGKLWHPKTNKPDDPDTATVLTKDAFDELCARTLELSQLNRARRWGILVAAAFCSAWAIWSVAEYARTGSGGLVSPIVLGGLSATMWFSTLRSVGLSRPAVLVALRERGRCARCAYDLSGLEPDDDGLITCPECGARWRVIRTSNHQAPHHPAAS